MRPANWYSHRSALSTRYVTFASVNVRPTRERLGAAIAVLAVAGFFAAALLAGHSAARADAPQITFQFPHDGDVLKEAPKVLQMCFKQPVNVRDLDKGGDFNFRIFIPDKTGIGLRIVFQPDGYGVAIYPGLPAEPVPEGEWTWDYRLTDAGDPRQVTEGAVKFSVRAQDGKDILQPTPPACLASGGTGTPVQPSGASVSSARSVTPAPANSDDGGGPDILLLSLGAVAVAAVLGALGYAGYALRRRAGFWPRRPPPSDGGPPGDTH